MKIICPVCKCETERLVSHVNRANKLGLKVYCGRVCAGIGRRIERTEEEKKRLKSEYDKEYRVREANNIKQKKHKYYKKTYDPIKAKEERKLKYQKHLQYLRTPEYKKWKKEYDEKFRAKKVYGEYWECAILFFELEGLIPWYEAKQENNLNNKSLKRKRLWKQQQHLNSLPVL